MRLAVVAYLLAALLPRAIHAADIKVSYLLESKPFKLAVAGTPLTFSLYTTEMCAGSPAATEVVNSEMLTLVEALKRTTPKRSVKAPGTSRIEHVVSVVTTQPVFYLKVTGAGVVPVGSPCQRQHATVNGADPLPPPPPSPATCAPDAVRSGPGEPCVDKYEASLWDIPAGNTALIQKVNAGTATLTDLTSAGASQISLVPTCTPGFPSTFPADGHYSAPLYAASLPGVKPTTCVTGYQAAVACQLSGKRLLTSAEWFAAGAGTVDTNVDNGSTDCATNAPGSGISAPVHTGSRTACVSTSGTYDQIGNVYEWTLDRTISVLTGLPSASTVIRGGAWLDSTAASLSYEFVRDPGVTNEGFGFRCGR